MSVTYNILAITHVCHVCYRTSLGLRYTDFWGCCLLTNSWWILEEIRGVYFMTSLDVCWIILISVSNSSMSGDRKGSLACKEHCHNNFKPAVRLHWHWHRYESGLLSAGCNKHKFARIPVAAVHINTSTVWIRVTLILVFFLHGCCI